MTKENDQQRGCHRCGCTNEDLDNARLCTSCWEEVYLKKYNQPTEQEKKP